MFENIKKLLTIGSLGGKNKTVKLMKKLETVVWRYSVKKRYLKFLQNHNTCAGVLFNRVTELKPVT